MREREKERERERDRERGVEEREERGMRGRERVGGVPYLLLAGAPWTCWGGDEKEPEERPWSCWVRLACSEKWLPHGTITITSHSLLSPSLTFLLSLSPFSFSHVPPLTLSFLLR